MNYQHIHQPSLFLKKNNTFFKKVIVKMWFVSCFCMIVLYFYQRNFKSSDRHCNYYFFQQGCYGKIYFSKPSMTMAKFLLNSPDFIKSRSLWLWNPSGPSDKNNTYIIDITPRLEKERWRHFGGSHFEVPNFEFLATDWSFPTIQE